MGAWTWKKLDRAFSRFTVILRCAAGRPTRTRVCRLCHAARVADSCSPCLLVHFLEQAVSSAPRNKSRTGPFPSGFRQKLVTKPDTTPRGDTGEEPSWVCKGSARWHTCSCCVWLLGPHPGTGETTPVQTAGLVLWGNYWENPFLLWQYASALVGWFCNTYETFFKKKS